MSFTHLVTGNSYLFIDFVLALFLLFLLQSHRCGNIDGGCTSRRHHWQRGDFNVARLVLSGADVYRSRSTGRRRSHESHAAEHNENCSHIKFAHANCICPESPNNTVSLYTQTHTHCTCLKKCTTHINTYDIRILTSESPIQLHPTSSFQSGH